MECIVVNQIPHIPIKDWAEDDQPRTKLIRKGATALSDAELLAILINTGPKNTSAIDLAKQLLRSTSFSLGELGKLNVRQFKKIKGIGDAKAVTLVAAMELSRRRQAGVMNNKRTITKGSDAALFFKPLLEDYYAESFHVMYLNHACRVLHTNCISTGSITNTMADPKIIFKEALELGATHVILCHNHPSGSLKPSHADIRITKQLKEAGRLLDIAVLDHIIVSEAGYCSMVEEGLMI